MRSDEEATNLVRTRAHASWIDSVPLMARRYRGIARSYLRGESRPYRCPARSQNELIVGARPVCARTREGFRSSNERFRACLPRPRWRKRIRPGE
jgi:hypothetical protein